MTLPVCMLLVTALGAPAGPTTHASREVRFSTADNVVIVGTYYSVPAQPAPAVVLVHGWQQTRSVWDPLPALLQKSGIAALTIDLRGHGASIRELTALGPMRVDPKEFDTRDIQKMQLDIHAAVDWLEENPDINKNRIALAGSSLGANLALRYAVANDNLAALVLLSPGLNYKDIRTDDAMGKLRLLPLRMIVSEYDPYPIESTKLLRDIRKELRGAANDSEMISYPGHLHGTDMLRGVKELPELLAHWLRQVLTGAPAPLPAQ